MHLHDSYEIISDDVALVDTTQMMTSLQIAEAHKIMHHKGGKVQEEQKALKIFERAAKLGSAEGLYNVALMYKNAQAGLVQDIPKALKLCHEAASQKPYHRIAGSIMPNVGMAQAETFIGISYRDGLGVDQV